MKKVTTPKKKAASKTPKPIGIVTHFYGHISVAIIKFKKPVKLGTEVVIRGSTGEVKQKIDSMQYDHKPIKVAPKGKEIGVKVKQKVHEGNLVFANTRTS